MLGESARLLAEHFEGGGTEAGADLPGEVLQRLERSATLLHSAIRSVLGPGPAGGEGEPPARGGPLARHWIEQGFDGIQGSSRAVTVVELLSFISSSQKSGILSVRSPAESFLVQLEDGRVVYARGDATPREERLGQLLLRSGALRREQLEEALASRGERDLRLGDLLEQRGLVTPEALQAALGEQVQRLFHRLCVPGDQRFRFFEGLRIESRPRVSMNVTQLLLECARIWDESVLEGRLEHASPAPVDGPRERTPACSFDEYLHEQLEAGTLELPLLDDTAAELLGMCWEEEVDADRLEGRIQRDPGLCGHLLRIANSVAFAPAVEITSVQLAVARLGLDNIREIALAMTVRQKAFQVPGHAKELRGLWHRAALTSGFAKSISRVLRLGAIRGGLLGLLQDLGKPVVLHLAAEFQERHEVELAADELEAFLEIHHARVGGALVQRWGMPDWLRQVVLHHHDCEAAQAFRAETRVAHLADRLAAWLEGGRTEGAEELLGLPVCEALGLELAHLQAILGDADRVLQMADVYRG